MKISIIGGYGKMGRWFAAYLKKEGNDVTISGRDREKLRITAAELGVKSAAARKAVTGADAVILSVPIDSFEQVVEEIAPWTRDGQLIFDVTSIKTKMVNAMHAHIKKGEVLGVHPMFGPGAAGVEGQRFVLTPVGAKEKALARKVRRYLQDRKANVVIMKPEEHDEIMGIVLGLAHFIALVSADTLISLGKTRESRAVAGTTYRLLLTMAQAVVSEDPDFYSSLQLNLPGMAEIDRLFQQKAARWASMVKKRRKQEFMDMMDSLKYAFEREDPLFGSAYKDMYRLPE